MPGYFWTMLIEATANKVRQYNVGMVSEFKIPVCKQQSGRLAVFFITGCLT